MKIRILGASALVSVIAVGCGPPSVEDVSGAVRRTVITTTAQAGSTSASMENMPQLGDLMTGVSSVSGSMPREAVPPLMPIAQLPRMSLPSVVTEKLVPDHTSAEIQAQGERLANFLETRVFTEENVESRTGDAVIFRVTGEDLCTDGTFAADPNCIAAIDQFEFRLRASRPNNSILVTLLMGPDRHEPYSIQMSEQFLAMSTNLNEVRNTILYISSVTGQATTGLPEVMSGIIELRATRGAGPHDFTLSGSALAPIAIEYTDPNGGFWSVHVAQGQDISTFQFIEAERRILAALDLGAVDYEYPNTFYVYDEATGTSTTTTAQMRYHLGGATYAFDTREGAVELLVTNVSLGDTTTTWSMGAHQLLALDVNPASGRAFDLHLQRDLAGRPVFQVRSEFDAQAAISLAPLRDHGQTVPAWADQDALRVQFTGGTGGPSWRDEPYNATTGFPGGLHVLSGTLTLSTDEAGVAPVVVSEGQCLVQSHPVDEMGNPIEGHPFAINYAAQACP